MLINIDLIIASFTAPEEIRTNPRSLLLLLPLVAAIAIVYKATKLPTIKPANFIKETILLFASIVGFIVITALVLHLLTWLITE